MIARVKAKIGRVIYEFEIDEKDELETLHKAIVLTSPRAKCNVCEAVGYESKYLTSNKSSGDKGSFTFVNCKCAKCGARSQLGQYKASGYFWKEYEKYDPSTKPAAKEKTDKEEDFPFGNEE